MRRMELGTGALVGGLLTAALMGIMYLAYQVFGLAFPPFDLFNWVARELPGDIVTFGIDAMIDTMRLLGISVVDTAKTAEQIMALMLFLTIGIVTGVISFPLFKNRKTRSFIRAGAVVGAIMGLPLTIISVTITQSTVSGALIFVWEMILFQVWGAALGWAYQELDRSEAPAEAPTEEETASPIATGAVEKIGRRQFLVRLGATTATITVVGGGLGAVLASAERRREERALAEALERSIEAAGRPPLPNADDPVAPVLGTRPELTPIKDHYKVFLQTTPTYIDGASWVLPITGMVDNPLMLTETDIRNNYDSRDQYVTISCISGRVGTSLIGTTKWTGASARDVLRDAGIQEGARYLIITSGDGFHETVELSLIEADERIMFCYDWDGMPLPKDHGYPLRIWIPDRYGMKQPKWITGMEITDEYREGYWVERNWDEEALVKTTSVIDTVAVDDLILDGDQQRVPVGGIAYSGDRGISKVEVRVDEGPWQEAQLRQPLSETTWVIWRYDWPFEEGKHTFEVRCTEEDGTPQIEERMGNRPSGATGIHSKDASL